MPRLIPLFLLLLTFLGGLQDARAGDAKLETRIVTLPLSKSKSAPRQAGDTEVDQLFDELEALEAPELEDHRAGDLSNNQVIIVVICLIIFFPLGIILLIIFLLDDDD